MAGKPCCMDWPICDHVVPSDYVDEAYEEFSRVFDGDYTDSITEEFDRVFDEVLQKYKVPTLCPRCGTTTVADWAQPLGDGDVEPIARCPACGWTS